MEGLFAAVIELVRKASFVSTVRDYRGNNLCGSVRIGLICPRGCMLPWKEEIRGFDKLTNVAAGFHSARFGIADWLAMSCVEFDLRLNFRSDYVGLVPAAFGW